MSATTLTSPSLSFTRTERLITGLSGLVAGALSVLMVGLYFVYSGPPPVANVLGRNLITVATFTGFLIFAAGLSRLLRAARGGDAGLSGSVAVTSLLVYVAVTLVATSLEVGTSLQSRTGPRTPLSTARWLPAWSCCTAQSRGC